MTAFALSLLLLADGAGSDVVRKAGEYVSAYAERIALARATEHYAQRHSSVPEVPSHQRMKPTAEATTRAIESDVMWVPTPDAVVIAFYRDVATVDQKPVRDRSERLAQLFPDGSVSAEARGKAAEILSESARHNLGIMKRTTSLPTLALTFLHPRNQSRFRWKAKGASKLEGRAAVELEFAETSRPTLTHTGGGDDVPARGSIWVASDDGAVLKTDLHFEGVAARVRVRYAADAKLGIVVPVEMKDSYGDPAMGESVEGVATYTDYKRGDVEIGPIRYR